MFNLVISAVGISVPPIFCVLKFLLIYTDSNCNLYYHWQNHGNKINYSKIDIHGVILFHFHPWAQSSFTLKITNSSVWEFGSLFPEISVFHMPKQREIFVQNVLLNKTKISCQYLFQKSFLLFRLWDKQFFSLCATDAIESNP